MTKAGVETPDSIVSRIRPRRKITGISAILLPFEENGDVDWKGFREHVARTADCGLTPAINMDTGYGNLIEESLKLQVLQETRQVLGGDSFVGGAFVSDHPGAEFDEAGYARGMEQIESHGGTPVIFQSFGLTQSQQSGEMAPISRYEKLSARCDSFIAFELSTVFAPFGAVYSLPVYEELVKISNCMGAKHSSLSRQLEWDRLDLRDRIRPDFKVYTGNDLAIDMVMYGSDYLLGLSTFAPDYFAQRDRYWETGDSAFYQLNDVLQYLGFFAFRDPVPAYKHDAAMFLELRKWIASDLTHSESMKRPETDTEVLSKILRQLEEL